MHELAAAEDVLRVVLEAAEAEQAHRVRTISLKVGGSYAIDRPRSLIAALAKDTVAEGARLEIESMHRPR